MGKTKCDVEVAIETPDTGVEGRANSTTAAWKNGGSPSMIPVTT